MSYILHRLLHQSAAATTEGGLDRGGAVRGVQVGEGEDQSAAGGSAVHSGLYLLLRPGQRRVLLSAMLKLFDDDAVRINCLFVT